MRSIVWLLVKRRETSFDIVIIKMLNFDIEYNSLTTY